MTSPTPARKPAPGFAKHPGCRIEAARIKDYLCFFHEKVDAILLDGEELPHVQDPGAKLRWRGPEGKRFPKNSPFHFPKPNP